MTACLGFLLLLLLHSVLAQTQSEDADLLSFATVSRPGCSYGIWHSSNSLSLSQLPHVRALKYNVQYHNRERVHPGYWFVSSYGQMDPEAPTHRYAQFQVGPYIYDGDGVCGLSQQPWR